MNIWELKNSIHLKPILRDFLYKYLQITLIVVSYNCAYIYMHNYLLGGEKMSQRGRNKVIYLKNDLREAFDVYCEEEEISFSKIVNDLLEKFLKERGMDLDGRKN